MTAKAKNQWIHTGILILGICMLIAIFAYTKSPSPEPGEPNHGTMNHDHIMLSGPANTIPDVDLVIHKDPKAGWNIQVLTKNFTFAPENASTEYREGEGHAHLYIDGEKITRLYGHWFYLESLEPGSHTVTVNLNANNHSPFVYQDKEITDSKIITYP